MPWLVTVSLTHEICYVLTGVASALVPGGVRVGASALTSRSMMETDVEVSLTQRSTIITLACVPVGHTLWHCSTAMVTEVTTEPVLPSTSHVRITKLTYFPSKSQNSSTESSKSPFSPKRKPVPNSSRILPELSKKVLAKLPNRSNSSKTT